jgi:hypothetical protein
MQSAKFRQRFAPWSQPFGQAPKRSAIRSAQWTPKVHGMSLDTCKTQTCDKCDNGCAIRKSTKFRDRFAPWSQPFGQAPRKTKAGDNENKEHGVRSWSKLPRSCLELGLHLLCNAMHM